MHDLNSGILSHSCLTGNSQMHGPPVCESKDAWFELELLKPVDDECKGRRTLTEMMYAMVANVVSPARISLQKVVFSMQSGW